MGNIYFNPGNAVKSGVFDGITPESGVPTLALALAKIQDPLIQFNYATDQIVVMEGASTLFNLDGTLGWVKGINRPVAVLPPGFIPPVGADAKVFYETLSKVVFPFNTGERYWFYRRGQNYQPIQTEVFFAQLGKEWQTVANKGWQPQKDYDNKDGSWSVIDQLTLAFGAIHPGLSGTAGTPLRIMADPAAPTLPVFDGGTHTPTYGITLTGNTSWVEISRLGFTGVNSPIFMADESTSIPAKDIFGDPMYVKDENGDFVLDPSGNKTPVFEWIGPSNVTVNAIHVFDQFRYAVQICPITVDKKGNVPTVFANQQGGVFASDAAYNITIANCTFNDFGCSDQLIAFASAKQQIAALLPGLTADELDLKSFQVWLHFFIHFHPIYLHGAAFKITDCFFSNVQQGFPAKLGGYAQWNKKAGMPTEVRDCEFWGGLPLAKLLSYPKKVI